MNVRNCIVTGASSRRAHGCRLISWTAPLARALLGREPGESVAFQGGDAEIVGIE
jgi:transcription elongation GreA/GreB family factor